MIDCRFCSNSTRASTTCAISSVSIVRPSIFDALLFQNCSPTETFRSSNSTYVCFSSRVDDVNLCLQQSFLHRILLISALLTEIILIMVRSPIRLSSIHFFVLILDPYRSSAHADQCQPSLHQPNFRTRPCPGIRKSPYLSSSPVPTYFSTKYHS